MTTLAQLIHDCRTTYLQTGRPDELNKLNGGINSSVTTLTCTYGLRGLTMDSRISINLEDMHVWSVDDGAKQADAVERAQYGSTAATHADGDLIRVNPRYSDNQIMRAMNRVAEDLSGEGLYQMATVELTADTSVSAYNLAPTDLVEVYDVLTQSTQTSTKGWLRVQQWETMSSAETDVFASGIALQIREPIFNGTQLRVLYKREFDAALATLADVVETVTGLRASAVDLLAIGAAIDLLSGKEVDRSETDSQRSSRRSQEVPSGAWTSAPRNLERLYKRRIGTERTRLDRLYPPHLQTRSY
ncbi:MAG: hypothetical protein GY773_18020 [Actinomycetia bacterium]|nr:hypothetical protein [Actinomycetes bacterium]